MSVEQQDRGASASSGDLLESLGDGLFRAIVVVFALLLVFGLIRLRFCYSIELPPKPAPPATSIGDAKRVAAALDNNADVYQRYLIRDSREYGLETLVKIPTMSEAIPYKKNRARNTLHKPKEGKSQAVVNGLKLSLSVARIKGTPRDMMILSIENLTQDHLAYRIDTKPSKGTQPCHQKVAMPYDAMVIAPGQTHQRSECLYRKGWNLAIRSVETMSLNPLSYHYVSQLPPAQVGVDIRHAQGHTTSTGGKPCKLLIPSKLKRAIASGETTWRDMVDFFARHSCKTYDFPQGYRAWEEDEQDSLPLGEGH